MFQAGDRVAEHLELVRLLGAGGMGSVWVAQHLRLRTEVAVKFLSASMLNNPAARSRFDREAQWVAQVKSPHVVQVLDQGVTVSNPPQPYIVMELLDGEDLGSRLERVGRLSLAEAAPILDQACAGLAAAHAVGLVHRDIKPENLFLLAGDRPFVKILDFGIARATQETELSRLTQTGGVIGTAHYMSPEQLFEGKQVDHRTDVWALGVVMYRMLTGSLPFDGTTYGDLCLAVNQGRYAPPSGTAPALSPQVDAFIARALTTDRQRRLASVKEFALELGTLVQRESAIPELASAQLPLAVSPSASGAVSATTGPRANTGTQALHTGTEGSITVDAVPMQRPGMLILAAIAGSALLGGVAFGAYRLYAGAAPADERAAAQMPLASSSTTANSSPKVGKASQEPAAVASAASEAMQVSVAEAKAPGSAKAGGSPGGSSAPARQRPAVQHEKASPTPKSGGKPSGVTKTANEGSSTNNVTAKPATTGVTPTPPQVPKSKYRGF